MLNRRNFIRTLTSAGALMSLPTLSACNIDKHDARALHLGARP